MNIIILVIILSRNLDLQLYQIHEKVKRPLEDFINRKTFVWYLITTTYQRITEWQNGWGWKGPLKGGGPSGRVHHLVHPLRQTGSPRAHCAVWHPGGVWISSEKESQHCFLLCFHGSKLTSFSPSSHNQQDWDLL